MNPAYDIVVNRAYEVFNSRDRKGQRRAEYENFSVKNDSGITVPVYVLKELDFEKLWPPVKIEERRCEKLIPRDIKIYIEENYRKIEKSRQNIDHSPFDIRFWNNCEGGILLREIIKYLSDNEWKELKAKALQLKVDIKSPGIYINDVIFDENRYPHNNKRQNEAYIQFVIAFAMELCSCYHLTTFRNLDLEHNPILVSQIIGALTIAKFSDIYDPSKFLDQYSMIVEHLWGLWKISLFFFLTKGVKKRVLLDVIRDYFVQLTDGYNAILDDKTVELFTEFRRYC